MKNWAWQIYSLVVAVIAMIFMYAIVNLPFKGAFIAATGLVVLLYFLLKNPVSRYLHLAIFLIFSWVGLVSGTSYKFSFFHEKFGEALFSFKGVVWYVHGLFFIMILVLLLFDFLSRKEGIHNGETNITKNVIEKHKYQLVFYAFVSLLMFLLAIYLINKVAPITDPQGHSTSPVEPKEGKSNLKTDYNDLYKVLYKTVDLFISYSKQPPKVTREEYATAEGIAKLWLVENKLRAELGIWQKSNALLLKMRTYRAERNDVANFLGLEEARPSSEELKKWAEEFQKDLNNIAELIKSLQVKNN